VNKGVARLDIVDDEEEGQSELLYAVDDVEENIV
jgi:hypothetical protein